MKDVLMCGVATCKQVACINDNVADEYILVALREAQDMRLKRVIGAVMFNKLKGLIIDKTIDNPENAAYKELLEQARFFLAYTAMADVCVKTSFKVSNLGVVQTGDENVRAASMTDVQTVKDTFQNKADFYCKELQRYILKHRAALPEISESVCHDIKAHLFDAATCGIFLGGPRGKICR